MWLNQDGEILLEADMFLNVYAFVILIIAIGVLAFGSLYICSFTSMLYLHYNIFPGPHFQTFPLKFTNYFTILALRDCE